MELHAAMFGMVVLTALARLVVAHDAAPPVLGPEGAVLFVRTHGVCPTDAGVDAPNDAGSDAGSDAGVPPDAGGTGSDAGVPTPCGDSVMMVVQPKFQIDNSGSKFALLYVTPGVPATRLEDSSTFDNLANQTAPAIEQVEVDVPDPSLGTYCPGCGGGGSYQQNTGGCGGAGMPWTPPTLDGGFDPGTLETVGPYEVAHVQAASRADLAAWLDGLDYEYTSSDLDAVEPYLALGWYVVAVRVSSTTAVDGELAPLSMTWSGSEIRVPLGLSHEAAPDPSSLTVYIASDDRVDLPGAHVSFAGRIGVTSVGYVTRNELTYDHTGGADADPIAVAEGYDMDWRDTITVTNQVHVPVEHCEDEDSGCVCNSRGPSGNAPWYLAAIVIVLRRRRC